MRSFVPVEVGLPSIRRKIHGWGKRHRMLSGFSLLVLELVRDSWGANYSKPFRTLLNVQRKARLDGGGIEWEFSKFGTNAVILIDENSQLITPFLGVIFGPFNAIERILLHFWDLFNSQGLGAPYF